MYQNKGFTLIELLVVVLIIGILASVALPEYTKAVWKSRAAELRSVTRTLATGQEAYFLANGSYPASFDELDIDVNLPLKGGASRCNLSTQDSRGNDRYELIINRGTNGLFALSTSMFVDGLHACKGFAFVHQQREGEGITDGKMYCVERAALEGAGSFCEKIMQARYVGTNWNLRMYELP